MAQDKMAVKEEFKADVIRSEGGAVQESPVPTVSENLQAASHEPQASPVRFEPVDGQRITRVVHGEYERNFDGKTPYTATPEEWEKCLKNTGAFRLLSAALFLSAFVFAPHASMAAQKDSMKMGEAMEIEVKRAAPSDARPTAPGDFKVERPGAEKKTQGDPVDGKQPGKK